MGNNYYFTYETNQYKIYYMYEAPTPHRLDGPAIEYANGTKVWCYKGKIISCSSQEQFEKYLKMKIFW